jgi:hypothetical protein
MLENRWRGSGYPLDAAGEPLDDLWMMLDTAGQPLRACWRALDGCGWKVVRILEDCWKDAGGALMRYAQP